jgi:ABC-type maltose transport system permease subunit
LEIIRPVADLFGISPLLLVVLTVGGVALVVLWYILKAALKIAWKVFAAGCLVIAIGMGTLFAAAVILGLLQ